MTPYTLPNNKSLLLPSFNDDEIHEAKEDEDGSKYNEDGAKYKRERENKRIHTCPTEETYRGCCDYKIDSEKE